MWPATAAAMSRSFCGVLKTQRFLASTGSMMRTPAASEIMGVPVSAATSIMASELGTVLEPTSTSTLFSLTSLRAFFTALVLSVASSSTSQLTLTPAMVVGRSATVLRVGIPSDAAGPVADTVTPTLICAAAAGGRRSAGASAQRTRRRRVMRGLPMGWAQGPESTPGGPENARPGRRPRPPDGTAPGLAPSVTPRQRQPPGAPYVWPGPVADPLGEDLVQPRPLPLAEGHPAVGTVGEGPVHRLQRALEDVAADAAPGLDARGGVELEDQAVVPRGGGAGARRRVVEDPAPGVGTPVEERAVAGEAGVLRLGGPRLDDAPMRVAVHGADPAVQEVESLPGGVEGAVPGEPHRVHAGALGEPDHLVVGVAGLVQPPLPGGEGLLGVVHVEHRLQVVADVDDGEVELAQEDVAAPVGGAHRGQAPLGARRRRPGGAVGREGHVLHGPGVEGARVGGRAPRRGV